MFYEAHMKKTKKKLLSALAAAAAAFALVLLPAENGGLCAVPDALGIGKSVTLGSGYSYVTMNLADSTHSLYYTLDGSEPDSSSLKYDGELIEFTSPGTIRAAETDVSGKVLYSKSMDIEVKCKAPAIYVTDNLDGTALITMKPGQKGTNIWYVIKQNGESGKQVKYTAPFKVTSDVRILAVCSGGGYKTSSTTALNVYDHVTESSYSDYITAALDKTNEARKKAGLTELKLDEALCRACEVRAGEISKDYSIKHTRSDGRVWYTVLKECGFAYKKASENIKYMTADGIAPAKAVEGWLNSSVHRENIMRAEYDRVGFAFVQSGNRVYWTQILAKGK